MKFNEFMGTLRRNPLKHVYLLSGEESYYIDLAKERILSMLFPDGNRADSLIPVQGDVDIEELEGMLGTVPLFAEKNVVVVDNTNLFRESKSGDKGDRDRKKLDRFISTLENIPESSYIIFVTKEKADKRRKLYKAVEKTGAVLEAEAVRAWNINEWLQGKLQSMNREMNREATAYFNGVVGMMQQISLSYLDQELDKLLLYSENRRITRQELAAVFSGLPEVSLFALMDAVSEKNGRKALDLLQKLLASGTYAPLILSLLVRHVRQLWQARLLMAQGCRGKDLGKPLELNPFIAEKLGRAAQKFSDEVLETAFLELADADYMMKTGQAGAEKLEHALILLCRR